MARSRPAAPLTLETRLREDLAMTGGTMPLAIIVADEAERTQARRIIAGRKGARLLTLVTAAESEAARAAWREGR
jgi:hypothetical protein